MTPNNQIQVDGHFLSSMEGRHNEVIDQQVRFIRRIYLVLLVTCSTMFSVAVSIEDSDTAKARTQLNSINQFLTNETFEEFQQTLDNGSRSFIPLSGEGKLEIGQGNIYKLCVNDPCSDPITFNIGLFNHYYIHGCSDNFERRRPEKPQTLDEFRQFYNTFMTQSCWLEINRLEVDRSIYYTGYVLRDPIDERYDREDTSMFLLSRTRVAAVKSNEHIATITSHSHNESSRYEDEIKSFHLFLNLGLEEPVGQWKYKEMSDVIIPVSFSKQNISGNELLPELNWEQPTFQLQFKELDKIHKDWGNMSLTTATSIINSLHKSSGGSASFLGTRLPSKIVYYWGTLLIVCTLFYFFAQLRGLNERILQYRNQCGCSPKVYPWLLLFGGINARVLLLAVVLVLPLVTIGLIGYSKLMEFGTLLRWDSIDAPFGALVVIILSLSIVGELHRIKLQTD
jgi:hypothetical protein